MFFGVRQRGRSRWEAVYPAKVAPGVCQLSLGIFGSQQEAARAYDRMLIHVNGRLLATVNTPEAGSSLESLLLNFPTDNYDHEPLDAFLYATEAVVAYIQGSGAAGVAPPLAQVAPVASAVPEGVPAPSLPPPPLAPIQRPTSPPPLPAQPPPSPPLPSSPPSPLPPSLPPAPAPPAPSHRVRRKGGMPRHRTLALPAPHASEDGPSTSGRLAVAAEGVGQRGGSARRKGPAPKRRRVGGELGSGGDASHGDGAEGTAVLPETAPDAATGDGAGGAAGGSGEGDAPAPAMQFQAFVRGVAERVCPGVALDQEAAAVLEEVCRDHLLSTPAHLPVDMAALDGLARRVLGSRPDNDGISETPWAAVGGAGRGGAQGGVPVGQEGPGQAGAVSAREGEMAVASAAVGAAPGVVTGVAAGSVAGTVPIATPGVMAGSTSSSGGALSRALVSYALSLHDHSALAERGWAAVRGLDAPLRGVVRKGAGWQAQVEVPGRRDLLHVGVFGTEEQAGRAHDLVVVRVRGLVGSRGHLNYPLSDVVGDMARLMGMPLEDVVKEARGPGGVAQRRESVGTRPSKRGTGWTAQIRMHWNGKAKVAVSLGTHASEEGAARAYDRAALAVKGRGVRTNMDEENYADEVPFLSRLGQHPDCLVLLLRRGDAAFGEALARYRESGTLPEAPSKEKEGEGEGEGGGGGRGGGGGGGGGGRGRDEGHGCGERQCCA